MWYVTERERGKGREEVRNKDERRGKEIEIKDVCQTDRQ